MSKTFVTEISVLLFLTLVAHILLLHAKNIIVSKQMYATLTFKAKNISCYLFFAVNRNEF